MKVLARAVSGDGRTDTVESRPESWKGEQEREPTFHRGMERKELSGQNYQGREGERMGERATWETDSLAASVERRSVAAFLPEIAERDRKGRKEGRRKDLSRKGGRREGGREAQWQMQPKEGREEGKGADIFHRKLSRYRSSWG